MRVLLFQLLKRLGASGVRAVAFSGGEVESLHPMNQMRQEQTTTKIGYTVAWGTRPSPGEHDPLAHLPFDAYSEGGTMTAYPSDDAEIVASGAMWTGQKVFVVRSPRVWWHYHGELVCQSFTVAELIDWLKAIADAKRG